VTGGLAHTRQDFLAGGEIAPVYIAHRTATELVDFLASQVPREGIAKLVGRHCRHDGVEFVCVTDWFTGEADATPVTATFTDAGLRQIELARADRYPDRETRPLELGIAHSHPFGYDPHFSRVDIETFTAFPYGVDNVHLLADPTIGRLKAYISVSSGPAGGVELLETPYVLYAPRAR
jgi:hypothetical protein